ncbi:MAG: hypothetical protein RLZZ271_241 [Pseudomonadota bacterium]|jgi:hypothetical protein
MRVQETFEKIKELLQSDKWQVCADSTLTIEEKGRQATLKAVHVASVGADAFSIKYDECGFPGTAMFAPHGSLHRACDAIAFCLVEDVPYILCCELKSSEPARHEVAEQFRSAHCFLDYLDSLLRHYYQSGIKNWSRRYFVFHDQPRTPASKRPLQDEFNNDKPERALFIPAKTGDRTYVRQLLGKPL